MPLRLHSSYALDHGEEGFLEFRRHCCYNSLPLANHPFECTELQSVSRRGLKEANTSLAAFIQGSTSPPSFFAPAGDLSCPYEW